MRSLGSVESPDGGHAALTLFDPPRPVVLNSLDSIQQRRTLFVSALECLSDGAAKLATPAEGTNAAFDSMLASTSWGTPLVPIMAALICHQRRDAGAARNLSQAALALALADREGERLVRYSQRKLSRGETRLLLQVAALGALCGGLARSDLLTVAAAESTALQLSWRHGVGDLVATLAEASADSSELLMALRPDTVAQAFVLRYIAEPVPVTESTKAILRHIRNHEARVTNSIVHATYNYKEQTKHSTVLSQWLDALVDHCSAMPYPTLFSALQTPIIFGIPSISKKIATLFEAQYAALVAQGETSAEGRAKRGALADEVGVRCFAASRFSDAVRYCKEAVDVQRTVSADGNPSSMRVLAGYLANLGSALTSYNFVHHGEGDDISPAVEAAAILRATGDLTQRSDQWRLAVRLHWLAERLFSAGRIDEALQSTELKRTC